MKCTFQAAEHYTDIRYRISQTIRRTSHHQIWEENGSASYSLNVAYLARRGRGASSSGAGFFSCFPPLKPRYVSWSYASYSLKNTVVLPWVPRA